MKTIRKKHHYTLIEIMTVIVIATILFGIGIPAFNTMIRGSNMTISIRQLSAKIQAARAYAVTNRCRVAVLLVEDESGVKDEYKFSAYRVCRIYTSSYTFLDWIEDEDWKTLPKGVLHTALPSDAPAIASLPVDSGVKVLGLTAAPDPGFKAIVFDDRGQLVADNSITINFRLGRYVSGSTTPVYTERDSDGKIINHPIEITKYTGKVKVKDPKPES